MKTTGEFREFAEAQKNVLPGAEKFINAMIDCLNHIIRYVDDREFSDDDLFETYRFAEVSVAFNETDNRLEDMKQFYLNCLAFLNG
jgi:hypothetical protein